MNKFETAVILAGGQSSRLGYNKRSLEINGQKLLDINIEKLNTLFKEIIVVTKADDLFLEHKVIYTKDEFSNMGPLAGIHAALKIATGSHVYLVACDMPNINIEYIKYLMQRIGEQPYDACVTRMGSFIEPFNAFYSTSLFNRIENDLKDNKSHIPRLLESLNCLYIEEENARKFSSNWDMFYNINTPKDLDSYINKTT